MGFPPLPTYARNDPLGPSGHNAVLERQDWLYDYLAVEHDPASGQHNTPHVPRSLGIITWDGVKYSPVSVNSYVTAASVSGVGSCILSLAPNIFDSEQGVLEVQPCDDTGGTDNHPWLATAKFEDDTTVRVHLRKNTAALNAQQSFAATDGPFFIGIRNKVLPFSAPRSSAAERRSRGDGLQVGTASWNPMVQAMGTNRLATLVAHTSAGLHNAREISKAWGYVTYDSANTRYQFAAHQGLGAGVVRVAQGQVRVYLANCVPAIVAPVQAFAQAVGANTDGSDHTGLRVAHVPTGSCVAASVDVFLYESYVSGAEYRWRAVDGDFFVRVHGA
jgi:hypothetical protein